MDGIEAALRRDELVERARILLPALRARAGEAEANRVVPAASIADLKNAGLFAILRPRRYGGQELDLETYVHVTLELGKGCGSTAWVYSVIAMHLWQIGMFPPEAQDEVFADGGTGLSASSYAPTGTAVECDGGWRLSGSWMFASGCDHTDWIILGCRTAPSPGAAPNGQGFVLVPRADWRIEDNWHVLGLAGTGSKNVVVTDKFVPRRRMLTIPEAASGEPPGIACNPGPLYRIPFFSAIGTCLCLPAVGIADGALEDYVETTRARTTRGAALGGSKTMAEFPTIQLRVAEAAALIDAAKLLLARDAADTYATVAAGRKLSVEQRMRNRRDHSYSVRLAVQAVDRLFESAGGQGLFSSHPVQRAWRDVHGAAKHISLNWDAVGTLVGKSMLGLSLDGAQF
ncbi:MAG: flavin-dependent monooxygenase [Alphaproteobacteria bacterium]|nr:flavin-dependent monooxygenase [Alphaproteobacteria bacterium]